MPNATQCPKCGWQNQPSARSCANCFASLEQAPKPPSQVERIQPGPRSVSSAPAVQIGPNPGLVAAIVILVAVVAVGAALLFKMKQNQPPPKPTVSAETVADQFLQSKKTGQLAKVKPYLSQASIVFLEKAFSSKQARSAGFDEAEVGRMFLFSVPPTRDDLNDCKVTIIKPAREDKEKNQAIVDLKLKPQGRTLFSGTEMDQLVLVNEAGAWKVDLQLTNEKNDSTGLTGVLGGH